MVSSPGIVRQRKLSRSRFTYRSGFTLIEVLVVVAIMALVMAILLPSLNNARKQSRRTVCLANHHQLAVAMGTYAADNKAKPPQWPYSVEIATDAVCMWAGGPSPTGGPTRLGMLYPRYVGKNENILYCPDAKTNALIAKGNETGRGATYPWTNWGKNYTYGSYDYRPYWYVGPQRRGPAWISFDYDRAPSGTSVAADAFSGWWATWGPYPSHTPIQDVPGMLYYNVSYVDGSAKAVKDFRRRSNTGAGYEFNTRAPTPVQQNPYQIPNDSRPGAWSGQAPLPGEYTPLNPHNNVPLYPSFSNSPLYSNKAPNAEQLAREQLLTTTTHIERGWQYFDHQR